MCVHACRSMCMCVHEWKSEEGHWVSSTITLLPHKGSLSLNVELSPSRLPATWPASSPRDPHPPVSSCPLQPLLPVLWLLVYAVMSGYWGTELRSSSLGSKSSYPWSHFPNSLLPNFSVFRSTYPVIFYFFFKVNFTDKFISRKQNLPKNTGCWGLSSM